MRRRLDVLLKEYKQQHSTGGPYRAACAVSKSGRSHMKKTITVVTGGHGGMGKAICKELGKTSAIVLAGRNPRKDGNGKSGAGRAWRGELSLQNGHCRSRTGAGTGRLCCIARRRDAGHPHLRCVAERHRRRKISSKSTRSAQSIWLRRFIRFWPRDGVMINFASVAAYTMPQNGRVDAMAFESME